MLFKAPPSGQWSRALGSLKMTMALPSQPGAKLDLRDLNQEQLQAVRYAGPEPLVILAAPGSGKTATLTMRIAYLIEEMHVTPSSILAVTFTRKSGDEMRSRIGRLLPNLTSSSVYTSTFHQLCLTIIRSNFRQCGFKTCPKIVDKKMQKLIAAIIVKELKSVLSRKEPVDLDVIGFNIIADVKKATSKQTSGNESDSDQSDNGDDDGEDSPFRDTGLSLKKCLDFIGKAKRMKQQPSEFDRQMAFILEAYDAALKSSQMMDLDDFIPIVVRLFQSNDEVLAQFQRRWAHILVDEFQDVSSDQLELIRLLRGEKGNLTVCGDEDQSIFGFRCGSSHTFKLLQSVFPSITSIVLHQTYRSTPQIIQAADNLIRYNSERTVKDLKTVKDNGSSVKIRFCYDHQAEIRDVTAHILHYYNDQHLKLSEIAILCRVRSVLNQFAEHLRHVGIPFEYIQDNGRISGREKKLPKQTRLILAFFELLSVQDPTNDQFHSAFFDVMKDTKGIGKKTIENVQERLKSEFSKDLLKVVSKFSASSRPSAQQKKLLDLVNLIRTLQAQSESLSIEESVHLVNSLCSSSVAQKNEEIDTLLRAAKEADESKIDLAEFCNRVRMDQSSRDKEREQLGQKDRIALSTVHQAKGKEWECVFVVRVNDGTLPVENSSESENNASDLEEERRICYVALTRAKSHLYLSCVEYDQRGGNAAPSRFLTELPRNIERWQPKGDHKSLQRKFESGPPSTQKTFHANSTKVKQEASSQWSVKSEFQSASSLLENRSVDQRRPNIPQSYQAKNRSQVVTTSQANFAKNNYPKLDPGPNSDHSGESQSVPSFPTNHGRVTSNNSSRYELYPGCSLTTEQTEVCSKTDLQTSKTQKLPPPGLPQHHERFQVPNSNPNQPQQFRRPQTEFSRFYPDRGTTRANSNNSCAPSPVDSCTSPAGSSPHDHNHSTPSVQSTSMEPGTVSVSPSNCKSQFTAQVAMSGLKPGLTCRSGFERAQPSWHITSSSFSRCSPFSTQQGAVNDPSCNQYSSLPLNTADQSVARSNAYEMKSEDCFLGIKTEGVPGASGPSPPSHTKQMPAEAKAEPLVNSNAKIQMSNVPLEASQVKRRRLPGRSFLSFTKPRMHSI